MIKSWFKKGLDTLREIYPGLPRNNRHLFAFALISLAASAVLGWATGLGERFGASQNTSDPIEGPTVTAKPSRTEAEQVTPEAAQNKPETEADASQPAARGLEIELLRISTKSSAFAGPEYQSMVSAHPLSRSPVNDDKPSIHPSSQFSKSDPLLSSRACFVPTPELDRYYAQDYESFDSSVDRTIEAKALPEFDVILRNSSANAATLERVELQLKRVSYTGYSAGGDPPTFATPLPVHGSVGLRVSAYKDRPSSAELEDPIVVPPAGGQVRLKLKFYPDMDADSIPEIWIGAIIFKFTRGLNIVSKDICLRHALP